VHCFTKGKPSTNPRMVASQSKKKQ